jgi:hypothetical protein
MNADYSIAHLAPASDLFSFHVKILTHNLQIFQVLNQAAVIFAAVTFVKLFQSFTGEDFTIIAMV